MAEHGSAGYLIPLFLLSITRGGLATFFISIFHNALRVKYHISNSHCQARCPRFCRTECYFDCASRMQVIARVD